MSSHTAAPGPTVGIDFGTTNSSIARRTPSGVELVRFAGDTASYRSILYLEKARHGILSSTGPQAIARYLAAHREGDRPGRLIQSLKSYLPSRSLTGTEVFGRPYTLEELISRILADLRAEAERQFGIPVRNAVVGRPVRFVGAETAEDEAFALSRLHAAFLRAGFEQITFELEPLGAARAYQAAAGSPERPERILIGDFGGGTSDFSLLEIGPETGPGDARRVLGNAGLPFAGDAFDAKIVRRLISPALGSESLARGPKTLPALPAWIYSNLERWHYLSFLRTRAVIELLTSARKRALEPEKLDALISLIEEDLGYQLHQAVQKTKVALSEHTTAEFTFAGPESGSFAYLDPPLRATVTRADFESWIAPELAEISATVDDLLRSAKVPHERVTHVFLTGGTSFVPAVRAIFESRFPGRVRVGNEFTSVAFGLALTVGNRE
jgi:hypothetical chaperone protein